MYFSMFFIIFLLNYIMWCAATSSVMTRDEFAEMKVISNLRAPFFELPCMRLGGTCASRFACPPGTKVGQRGLCPHQQRLGMECCKPLAADLKCSARNGYCLPKLYNCRNKMLIEMIDCLPTEICCLNDYTLLRAPYFELPCMRIGGTCANRFACPPGTKVGKRGLCPHQQHLDMECCKPLTADTRCSERSGYCLPKRYNCNHRMSRRMIDCLPREICCLSFGY